MSMEFLLATGIGFVTACGIYLMLRGRTFTVVLGLSLFGYAVNVFIFVMGRLWSNAQPILSGDGPIADPLPQALVLTAIVITLSVAAFVMTMAYRSFQINGDDEVADDIEDARIAALARADRTSDTYEDLGFSDTGDDVVSE